jgi:hypothetical protein
VGLAVADDPGHRLADVLDLAVGPDQDDDLGAVLDQGLEALLAGPELGRPLDDPGLQVPGQRGVLQQAEHLPADQGDDDEGSGPGGERVEDALLDLGHGADRQGPDDGDVGQEHAHPVHARAGLLLLVDRVRVRLPGGQEDEQVAEEPAGVDQPPGGAGLAGRSAPAAARLSARLDGRALLRVTVVTEAALRVGTFVLLLAGTPLVAVAAAVAASNVVAWTGYAGMRAEVAAADPRGAAMTWYMVAVAAIEAAGTATAALLPRGPDGLSPAACCSR